MNRQSKQPRLSRAQTKLHQTADITLRDNSQEVIRRGGRTAHLVGTECETEASLSIAREWILVFFIRGEAGVRRQAQEILATLVLQYFNARARNWRRPASATGEDKAERIDHHRSRAALDGRDIVGGEARGIHNSATTGDRTREACSKTDAKDLARVYPSYEHSNVIVTNRGFAALVGKTAVVELQRTADIVDCRWQLIIDDDILRRTLAAVL